jgi:hypothetical protein
MTGHINATDWSDGHYRASADRQNHRPEPGGHRHKLCGRSSPIAGSEPLLEYNTLP